MNEKSRVVSRRSMMLRSSAALAARAPMVGAAGWLAACGATTTGNAPGDGGSGGGGAIGAVPDRPVTLTYLNFFGPADPQNVLFPHALSHFQAKHPRVQVDQISTNGTGQNVMTKYQSLAAAGTTPDFAALNPQYVEPLRARGALADLTPYTRRDAKAFQAADFTEATLLRSRKDGKWHAIPLQMGLWFLIYNAGVFQQAGQPAPDATWTWERYLTAARAVLSKDPNNLGVTMPPYELPVRGNGGDVLSKDEKRCLLDEAVAVEAIQWMADLRLKHRISPGQSEMGGQNARQLFDAGRLAAHIGDPGFLSQTQRGKLGFAWDIASVPRGKAARVSTVKGPSLVMLNESKEKDSAWAWLLHYTSPEMQRYVAVEGKVVSARTSALKAYVALDEGFNKNVLLDTASIARPMPYVAKYDEVDREIQDGLDEALAGTQPVKTAMSEVVRKVNLILAS